MIRKEGGKTTHKQIELEFNSLGLLNKRCFLSPIDKGIESKNYIVNVNLKNNPQYILKIYSNNNEDEIKSEIEILKKLNSVFNVKFFPIIQKGIFYVNKRPSILVKYIPGNTLLKTSISPHLVKEIAKKQAEIHRALIKFRPKYKKTRVSIFDFSFINFCKNIKSPYYSLLNNEIGILKEESTKFVDLNLRKSFIHEDLSLENIIINNKGDVNFIDFGESYRAEIISDISTAIKEIIISNKGLDLVLIKNYLDSYIKVISLKKNEIGMLFFLFKRRTIFMLAYYISRFEIDRSARLKFKIKKEIRTLKILHKNKEIIGKFINKYCDE